MGKNMGKPWENGGSMGFYGIYPLVIKHGVLENGSFVNDFPINTSIHRGFSIAMFDYQRVSNPNMVCFHVSKK